MAKIVLDFELTHENLDATIALLSKLGASITKLTENVLTNKVETQQLTLEDSVTVEKTEKALKASKKEKTKPVETKDPITIEVEDTWTNSDVKKPEQETPIKEDVKVDKTAVRAAAVVLSKAGKQDVIKEIFAKYNAEKLSDITEDNYPSLLADLEGANG